MKRYFKKTMFGFLFVLAGFFVTAPVFAGAPETEGTLAGYCQRVLSGLEITASGALDFYSKYVWRGFTLDKDPVLQPSFSVSAKGLTFTFWSSMDTDNEDSLNSNEIDLIVDYTRSFGDLSLSVGHTYYDFPGTNGYSREFYAGVGLCKIPVLDLPITSKLTYYYDYGKEENGGGDGGYLSLALGYSRVLLEDPKISLDLGTVFGYNHQLFIKGDGGHVTLTAGLGIPITKSLTFKPNVNYAIPLDDLKNPDDGNQKNRFFGGFSMAYTF